jgi:hypothetical protein
MVAANLGLNKTPTFGDDPRRGGGLFQMKRIGYDDAEFYFNGWDKDIGRVARQLIEVRKGSNPDIRLAVVRKIIEIIRAQEPGEFIWVSRRMSRMVPLSARPCRQRGARRLSDARVLQRRAALAFRMQPRATVRQCPRRLRGPPRQCAAASAMRSSEVLRRSQARPHFDSAKMSHLDGSQ